MKKYTAKLVNKNKEVIAEFDMLSKSLAYAKHAAWHKWDFSMIEGNIVLLMWDNSCLSRKIRQAVWKSETLNQK